MDTTYPAITATAIRIAEAGTAQGLVLQAGRYELLNSDIGFGTGDHFRSILVDAWVAHASVRVLVKFPTFFYASELAEGTVTVLYDRDTDTRITATVIEAVDEI